MGDCDPMDVLPQTIKRSIDLIDSYIVENDKTARKSIKIVNPEKTSRFKTVYFKQAPRPKNI
jgi:16S rRNA (cytidine1402-2'-O)-methyltransferase